MVYFTLLRPRVALRCKFSKSLSVVNVVGMCFYAWVCVLLVGVCPSCLPNLLFLLAARLLHLTDCVFVCVSLFRMFVYMHGIFIYLLFLKLCFFCIARVFTHAASNFCVSLKNLCVCVLCVLNAFYTLSQQRTHTQVHSSQKRQKQVGHTHPHIKTLKLCFFCIDQGLHGDFPLRRETCVILKKIARVLACMFLRVCVSYLLVGFVFC